MEKNINKPFHTMIMKISVIIPMYNEEENALNTLARVNDVLKIYNDYEIIAVDDGSADDTFKLINEFAF
ncbi:MAG: glycosyltransferase, partial [Methanobacterium sp.]